MSNGRFQQFTISFLIVLSLLVSSVSVCMCAMHQPENAEAEMPSCHQQAHETKNENSSKAKSPEIIQTVISECDCCRFQPAPKIFVKNENLKVEKQAIALWPKSTIEFTAIPQLIAVKTIDFEPPFYLSDSFYNLAPSRGPPRFI